MEVLTKAMIHSAGGDAPVAADGAVPRTDVRRPRRFDALDSLSVFGP